MGFYKKILAWFCVLFLCLAGCGKSSQQGGSGNQSGSDNTTETSTGNNGKEDGKTENNTSDNKDEGNTGDNTSNLDKKEDGKPNSGGGDTGTSNSGSSGTGSSDTGTSTQAANTNQAGTIKLGDKDVAVQWENNDTVEALKQLSPLTVQLSPYGDVELSGNIGTTIPTIYEPMTTSPGDIVIYNGDTIIVVAKPNDCNYTKIGKITGMSESELADLLAKGNVTLTLDFR